MDAGREKTKEIERRQMAARVTGTGTEIETDRKTDRGIEMAGGRRSGRRSSVFSCSTNLKDQGVTISLALDPVSSTCPEA